MDIWQACAGVEQIIPLRGRLVRLVENQGQVATLQLVDTLEEQALLEQLLESSKPSLPPGDDPTRIDTQHSPTEQRLAALIRAA